MSATRWRGSRSSSISLSASSASEAERRALRLPLAALGPVSRRRRLGLLLPVLAVAAIVAGLLVGGDDPEPGAAGLAPPDAALWVRAETGDEVWELVRRFPSLRALQERSLGSEDDVRPWVGGELALALPAAGGDPLVIAEVADRAAAERFRRRLETASAFAGDFLVIGPRAEVERASARTVAPSLADAPVYRRAAELGPGADRALRARGRPAAAARGRARRRARGRRLRRGAALRGPRRARAPESGGVRVSARVLRAPGAPPAQEFARALQGRAPASAAAFLDAPGADALVTLLERGGAGALLAAVRAALPELAGLDLDRDVLGPLGAEAAVTLTARGATPVFTAHRPHRQPTAHARGAGPTPGAAGRATHRRRARLPGARRQRLHAACHPRARAVVRDRRQRRDRLHGRLRAFQRTLAQRGLAQELVLRAVADQTGGRIEALAFADLRQLLALGERTGPEPRPGLPSRARRPSAGARRRCRHQARGVRFDRGAVPRDPMSEMNDNDTVGLRVRH